MHRSLERLWPWIAGTLCILFFVCLLAATKNPIALDDGLRHFAMAKVLRAEGFLGAGWNQFLYHGFFAATSFDPWLIPEFLLAPLTDFSVGTALKIFAVTQAAILLLSFGFLLRTLRAPPRVATLSILLLGLTEVTFTERLLLGRPFPLAVALALLCIAAILRERFVWVTAILAVAALLSHLFLFPLFVTFSGVVWLYFTRSSRKARACLIAGCVGTAIGILLHPEPAMYVQYLFAVFWRIPFLQQLHLGNELHGGLSGDIRTIVAAMGFLALLIAVISSSKPTWGEPHLRLASFFILPVILLFLGTLAWARTIDLLWPLLLAAIAGLLAADPTALQRMATKLLPARLPRTLPLLLLLLYIGVQSGTVAVHVIERDSRHSLDAYRALEKIPADAKVLNVDWDLFPIYVLLRPDLTYATGMDPSFTYLKDPEASKLLEMLWSAPFHSANIVNVKQWLKTLSTRMPGDVLVLDVERHKIFIEDLKQEKVAVLSETGALVIFRIK